MLPRSSRLIWTAAVLTFFFLTFLWIQSGIAQTVVPHSANPPTIDGTCTEYTDALTVTFAEQSATSTVYLKYHDGYLYVCMTAVSGTFASRFASVYLDPNDGKEAVAQSSDLSLRVDILTGSVSAYRGTGVANGYVIDQSITGWNAAASSGNNDTAEWKIPVGLVSNTGRHVFGISVYHHWVSGVGNDYGWPNNQYFDAPSTWQEARFKVAPVYFDYDGDRATDVSAFHLPSDQFFTDYLGNMGQYGWGGADCYPLVWDYNGDGQTEVSMYHFPTNQWFVKGYPGDSLGQFGWNGAECVPVPGDYNGDGITERAFYHSPTNRWFVEWPDKSVTYVDFGYDGGNCIPVPGDYDGDGVTDMVLYHIPSNQWFMYGVGDLGQYGWGGDDCLPIPGDYDGDGKTDIAVFHIPTNQWFVKGYPGDNMGQFGWGGLESFPIPGDYNGDGVTRRAFYRAGENRWFIEGEPEFVWGWDGGNFLPITSQVAIGNWFRFVVLAPNTVGMTQAAAEAAILNSNLQVGSVTTSNSNTVPVGSVISQSPVGWSISQSLWDGVGAGGGLHQFGGFFGAWGGSSAGSGHCGAAG